MTTALKALSLPSQVQGQIQHLVGHILEKQAITQPQSLKQAIASSDVFTEHHALRPNQILSTDFKANLLKVQINGEEIIQLELNESGIFSLPLKFIKDSYVTIEVIGKANEIYQAIYPGFYPYAFSNPIYVDANKDGIWTEPGLINN